MPSRTSRTRQVDALLSCATFKVRDDGVGLLARVYNFDLAGVGDLYTDPQIHTIDGRGMGLGNNGSKGIQRWVASHRCNAICRQLKLPQVGADAKPGMSALEWAAAMVLIIGRYARHACATIAAGEDRVLRSISNFVAVDHRTQVHDSLGMADAIQRQLLDEQGGSVVKVLDVSGANVQVVGALVGCEQRGHAAASAPSPPPLLAQPQSPPKQLQVLPSDMHLSVPRLLDAFLQPPSPKSPVQQTPTPQRRLSADEQQERAAACTDNPLAPGLAGCNPLPHLGVVSGRDGGVATRRPSADGASPGGVVTRRPSADGVSPAAARSHTGTDSPLATQRDTGAAARFPAFQPADLPAFVTPGAPPAIPSAWSLSIMREGVGEAGVELVKVQLMTGDNLVGTPKGKQEEQGLVVRLRR